MQRSPGYWTPKQSALVRAIIPDERRCREWNELSDGPSLDGASFPPINAPKSAALARLRRMRLIEFNHQDGNEAGSVCVQVCEHFGSLLVGSCQSARSSAG